MGSRATRGGGAGGLLWRDRTPGSRRTDLFHNSTLASDEIQNHGRPPRSTETLISDFVWPVPASAGHWIAPGKAWRSESTRSMMDYVGSRIAQTTATSPRSNVWSSDTILMPLCSPARAFSSTYCGATHSWIILVSPVAQVRTVPGRSRARHREDQAQASSGGAGTDDLDSGPGRTPRIFFRNLLCD